MARIVGDLGGALGGTAGRVTPLAGGAAEIDGLALVTDVNEQFELNIDEDTYTTVGGYALGRLGRRARVGDVIEVAGRRMTVIGLDKLRVARVRLSAPANGSEEANGADAG
jgi:putative hemolysin